MGKKILFIIGLLSFTWGLQAQTDNPKKDPKVQQKFAEQMARCYFNDHDYWQLERLCDEKADSICTPILTWGRGMAAARFFRFEEARELLGKYVEEYQNVLPEIFMLHAADELAGCLWWSQEYDEAAKVCDTVLQFFADEGTEDEHEGAIRRFTENRDRNLAFASLPKMTMSCVDADVRIPFRIKTIRRQKEKNMYMTIGGSLQNKQVRMMFDTGFALNSISRRLAEELHLKPIEANVITDGAGQSNTTFVMADSMQIGNVMFRNVKFSLNDLDDEEVSDLGQVIIGEPIIQTMNQYTIDFKKKVITSSSQPLADKEKNLAFDTEGGGINIRISRNGKPIDMMIDTGNGNASTLSYGFYQENQQEVDKCKVRTAEIYGVGGNFTIEQAEMKNFKFTLNGNQYRFPRLAVMKSNVDAALGDNNMGLPFLSSFKHVTISLKDAHIEFE